MRNIYHIVDFLPVNVPNRVLVIRTHYLVWRTVFHHDAAIREETNVPVAKLQEEYDIRAVAERDETGALSTAILRRGNVLRSIPLLCISILTRNHVLHLTAATTKHVKVVATEKQRAYLTAVEVELVPAAISLLCH